MEETHPLPRGGTDFMAQRRVPNYSWALEMQVEDRDGNVLRIGSDPREDEPFGEWLDMHGCSWPR